MHLPSYLLIYKILQPYYTPKCCLPVAPVNDLFFKLFHKYERNKLELLPNGKFSTFIILLKH